MINPYRCLKIFLVPVIWALCAPLSLYAYAPAKGMFLVADEGMIDPRFKSRVILLIQHDAEGSAGLIVNRSSRLQLGAVLPKDSQLDFQGKSLSYGGPVDPNALLVLVKVHKNPPEPAEEILTNLYLTGIDVLDRWSGFDDEVINYRAFTGYAGWAPGQLNQEMQRGSWHVVPADEESVFAGRDETLWKSLNDTIAAEK